MSAKGMRTGFPAFPLFCLRTVGLVLGFDPVQTLTVTIVCRNWRSRASKPSGSRLEGGRFVTAKAQIESFWGHHEGHRMEMNMLGNLSITLLAAAFIMITFPAAADPAHSPQTQVGYLNPSLFHIIRYDSERHIIENGQWVLKTRTPQYRIGYGALSKQGKHTIRFNFAIYFRTFPDRHACASGWSKHTVQPNTPRNDGDFCVDDIDDEPLLSGVLILLGEYAEKVAHLRIHLSIPSVRAADSSFEFWLHPDFWENYKLHETILARLRASAA